MAMSFTPCQNLKFFIEDLVTFNAKNLRIISAMLQFMT